MNLSFIELKRDRFVFIGDWPNYHKVTIEVFGCDRRIKQVSEAVGERIHTANDRSIAQQLPVTFLCTQSVFKSHFLHTI